MTSALPTGVFARWQVAGLRDSMRATLGADRVSRQLHLFCYAITQGGWLELRSSILRWRANDTKRSVTAIVGTDHALTDPAALRMMRDDSVGVKIMTSYQGVFHPKVVWLAGPAKHHVWIASNNLTRDGLTHNIEFAALLTGAEAPDELLKWANELELSSTSLSDEILQSYETQRRQFEAARARAGTTTFVWDGKREPPRSKGPVAKKGDLVLEVMPKETGSDGRQLQIPMAAAAGFFGLTNEGGAQRPITLKSATSGDRRVLTMTLFQNKTVRLSIHDLDFRDRPCVIVFRKALGPTIRYEIVSRNIFPSRYRSLLEACDTRTRTGSRRWTIVV